MDFIKEVCNSKEQKNTRVVIRTKTYASSLDYFDKLYEEAHKDFPEIPKKEMQVTHYGGIRYKYTFGIEFNVKGKVPEDYQKISKMESTL